MQRASIFNLMKRLVLFITAATSLSILISCEQTPNQEENLVNLDYVQDIIRKYDKIIPQLLQSNSREESRTFIYEIYNVLKKDTCQVRFYFKAKRSYLKNKRKAPMDGEEQVWSIQLF